MLTGQLRSQIDRIWDAFWSGGISNPLEVIEQITYLLFLRRLDDLQILEENKAARLGQPIERRIFPEGKDSIGRPYDDLRWSRFKNLSPAEMYAVVSESVFPFLRTLGADESTYAHHMKDARFTIPTPALLAKVVDLLGEVPMEDRDTKGDLYEYMLGKIATAGQNGQFRTPRHIIALMVEMTAPQPTDLICDPACGTAGFLVAAGEHLRERYPGLLHDAKLREHFHHRMFHGFDFDNTMLRIGSMNMLLHGVENPDIRYRDSLAQDHAADEEAYTLVLANPPFAGSLDYENTAKDLLAIVSRAGGPSGQVDLHVRAALSAASFSAIASRRMARRFAFSWSSSSSSTPEGPVVSAFSANSATRGDRRKRSSIAAGAYEGVLQAVMASRAAAFARRTRVGSFIDPLRILAAEPFPTPQRHFDVDRVDLHGIAAGATTLGGNQSGPRTAEGFV
jgi:hypothetical protein